MPAKPAAASRPLEPGPQEGAPPSLEFVALDRLNVDPAYQRAVDSQRSHRLIRGMVAVWQWPLCQPLAVARREDGSLWVLDGQHRLAGARERGDIAHLPCVVQASASPAAEAATFGKLNTERQNLSEFDKFAGMLAAGDADAAATAVMLEDTGWRVRRSSNTKMFEPGDLHCAPMLVRARRQKGEPAVRAALIALRTAWPDQSVTSTSTFLRALLVLVGRGTAPDRLAGQFAARLGQREQNDWIALGHRTRAARPELSYDQALALSIEAGGVARAATTASDLVPAHPEERSSPSRARLEGPPSQPSGKLWCDQCDRAVTPASAAACRDRFCKQKEPA